MEIKIAVASSDGVNVNQHFGRATKFRIYRLDTDSYEYIEERATVPACSGQQHSDYGLEQTAALITDCQGVVVSQIGAGAIDVCIAQRTLPFSLEGSIDEAMQTLIKSNRFKHLREK
jgi:predicted Fe-Mo cluster-binding NifX family protein